MKTRFVSILIAVILAAAAGATAIASQEDDKERRDVPVERQPIQTISSLEVFAETSSLSASELRARDELSRSTEDAPEQSLSSRAEIERAQPFSIPGASDEYVWVAPTDNGGVCIYTPGNTPGFSSACSGLDQFNEQGLVSVAFGPGARMIAASVQPSDVPDPVIRSREGVERVVKSSRGVVVVPLDAGDRFESGGLSIDEDLR